MRITLEQALAIARHQKEIGCCSANGQAIVLLYDEVERLRNREKDICTIEVDARFGLPFI